MKFNKGIAIVVGLASALPIILETIRESFAGVFDLPPSLIVGLASVCTVIVGFLKPFVEKDKPKLTPMPSADLNTEIAALKAEREKLK